MAQLRPGDIGLVAAGHGVMGKLANVLARFGIIQAIKFEHAVLLFYERGPVIIEASTWGVRCAIVKAENYVWFRPRGADVYMGRTAASYASTRLGEAYGWRRLLMLALEMLKGGRLAAKEVVCTELVLWSWQQAGADLVPVGTALRLVPDRIAEHCEEVKLD